MVIVKRCIHIIFIIGGIQALRLFHITAVLLRLIQAGSQLIDQSCIPGKHKIKHAVHSAGIIFCVLRLIGPGLSHQIGVRINPLHHIVKPGQNLHIGLRVLGHKFLYRVQAEACHALLQPEFADLFKFCPHLFTVQIQIRHLRPEICFIIPIRICHLGVAPFHAFVKIVILHIGTLLCGCLPVPDALQVAAGLLEPGMCG